MKLNLKSKVKSLIVTIVILATSAVTSEAEASGGEGFGKAGQLAIGANSGLAFRHQSIEHSNDKSSVNILALAAVVDYFAERSLSLGASIGYNHLSNDDISLSGWFVGPRAGYNVEFSDTFSFWPKAGIRYLSGSVAFDESSFLGSVELKKLTFQLEAPLLIHAAPHFFLGVGPKLDLDLSSKASSNGQEVDGPMDTSTGLAATIGGYF